MVRRGLLWEEGWKRRRTTLVTALRAIADRASQGTGWSESSLEWRARGMADVLDGLDLDVEDYVTGQIFDVLTEAPDPPRYLPPDAHDIVREWYEEGREMGVVLAQSW